LWLIANEIWSIEDRRLGFGNKLSVDLKSPLQKNKDADMSQTIFITGTSSGFGKATAEFFLDKGWNVIATMRRPEAAAFSSTSERLKILSLDVTNAKSIEQAIKDGVAAFGGIDVLVNNAGIGLASAVEATTDAKIEEIFETNTFGLMKVCRAIIPHMRKQGGGTIVNVTSSTAIAPMPLSAVYSASKCAADGFTEAMAYELEQFGIKTKLVEPGYAPTTQFTANGGDNPLAMIPEDYGAFMQGYFGKLMNYPTAYTAEIDVAEAVYAAATDGSSLLRYPAGADCKFTADMRWSGGDFMAKIREAFVPTLAAEPAS
jgi:NAD(P)-dependent dehydrogenase (short-subunit alcohol dehydrogenase family)